MNEIDSQTGNLFVRFSSAADEKLVVELLSKDYTIRSDDRDLSKEGIDLVVVDYAELNRLYQKIHTAKKQAGIAYLPIMVMVSNERMVNEKTWEIADDVVVMPVGKKNLQTRIKGLIKIPTYSRQVQVEQRKLEKKNSLLQLYYNAIDATTSGLVISDPSKEDNPIIFCNKAFTELTGYTQSEVIGQNCRFLQGHDRDQAALTVIRNAIEKGEACDILLRNYRKDGSLFWNELKLSPIKSHSGEVDYFVGIQNDVTELVETQKKLESAKDQWEGIVAYSPNLILISHDSVVLFVNKIGAYFLGFDHPDDVIGKTIYELQPEFGQDSIRERIEKLKSGEQPPVKLYTLVDNDGNTRYIKVQSIPITYKGQPAAQTVGVDVTQMKESEMELASLLQQKQVLLQEVHHRVKNNLAIISGLIELQIPRLENKEAVSYLRDTQMRIISIASVHEMLYGQENLHEVELDQYIEQLVHKIENTVDLKEQKINITLDMDSVTLSLDQAIPCGLLLNELITNSIKHGFNKNETIKIDISVSGEDDCATIRYRDYGKGMPESTDFASTGNLGSTIILILIEQLNAEYSLETRGGMQMTINFKRAQYRGPSQKYS